MSSLSRTTRLAALVLVLATVSACGKSATATPEQPAGTAAPPTGACRTLTPKDTEAKADASSPGPCAKPHTAETFLSGTFPAGLATAAYDDRRLGTYVFATCGPAFAQHLGSDESEVLRSLLSWVWFRPSESAWQAKARWFRCDVVGGPAEATAYRPLPEKTRDLLGGAPVDTWLRCAQGEDVSKAPVPCTETHDWRAVTTVKLGQPEDPYPGDRLVRLRSEAFCSDSVGGWLGYPSENYDYAMTLFHTAEWKAGNRRTICWARTPK